jgi:hypothetical protein
VGSDIQHHSDSAGAVGEAKDHVSFGQTGLFTPGILAGANFNLPVANDDGP